MKTKIESHGDEVKDFHNKEIPKVDSNYNCLAVITLGSVLKKDENYYLQVFLKECKYIEKKVFRHINDDLSDFSYSHKERYTYDVHENCPIFKTSRPPFSSYVQDSFTPLTLDVQFQTNLYSSVFLKEVCFSAHFAINSFYLHNLKT